MELKQECEDNVTPEEGSSEEGDSGEASQASEGEGVWVSLVGLYSRGSSLLVFQMSWLGVDRWSEGWG